VRDTHAHSTRQWPEGATHHLRDPKCVAEALLRPTLQLGESEFELGALELAPPVPEDGDAPGQIDRERQSRQADGETMNPEGPELDGLVDLQAERASGHGQADRRAIAGIDGGASAFGGSSGSGGQSSVDLISRPASNAR